MADSHARPRRTGRLRHAGLRPPESIRHERAARRELRRAVDALDDARRAAGTTRPMSRWWWAPVILALLVALALAGTGVTAWVRTTDAYTDADFETTASDVVALLLSPAPDRPQQVRRILDEATGAFYDEFAQSAEAYTDFVRRSGSAASATIDGTGVSSRTDSTATVLVAATVGYRQDTSASSDQAVPDRRFRLRVVVTDDSNRLKVAAVQYLP